ncbi:hypothetical protein FDENT_9628 [Fusarium denticulatum]|uniref:Uncharacterized protein n=1 Tax=Fusarium denticulatum TaxID=48507 RepID=A0A8H5TRG5_9HYPO|nr:hypothetical protein FDENT_9628 [Fusarium denticulatum]
MLLITTTSNCHASTAHTVPSSLNSRNALTMSFIQNSLTIGDYSIRCVLLLFEIAGLLAIFFGIPSSFVYFAWFTQQQLWPAISSSGDSMVESREAFSTLVLNAGYSLIVIWGIIPYFSLRESLSHRFRTCTAVIFLLNSAMLTVLDLRLELFMRTWWFQFESIKHVYLAKHCQAIAVFLCVLLGLGLLLLQLLVYYTMVYGTLKVPRVLRQVLEDTKRLLERCQIGRSGGSGDSPETQKIMDSEVWS